VENLPFAGAFCPGFSVESLAGGSSDEVFAPGQLAAFGLTVSVLRAALRFPAA
jgi:hypothetical protein